MSQGYGVDTWCLGALQPGRYARGVQLVIQALFNRLDTPRGTLQSPLADEDDSGSDDESAYGFDVAGYIGAVGYPTAIAALPSLIRGELLKDDRVLPTLTVEAFLEKGADGNDSITLSVFGELADESGSFDLTLSANDVTITILGGAS